MKKGLVSLFIIFVLSTSSTAAFAAPVVTTANTVWSNFKDAVVRDVKNSFNETVNVASAGIKLSGYKAQLAQKQKQLQQIEASRDNFFLKNYRKFKVKQEISELEGKIKQLEQQLSVYDN